MLLLPYAHERVVCKFFLCGYTLRVSSNTFGFCTGCEGGDFVFNQVMVIDFDEIQMSVDSKMDSYQGSL